MTTKKRVEADPEAALAAVQRGAISLPTLARRAAACRACDLWARATQTVFGSGSVHSSVVFIGEQPGNEEDRRGLPFVGPAGALLDKALQAAGIDRQAAYVTNVVKHFSWEERGKWRIHKKPRPDEIRACRPWLDAELAAIKPVIVVCLGATAAQALLGRNFRVTRERGHFIASPNGYYVTATIHPSAILRAPDDATRRAEFERFTNDLQKVARFLHKARAPARASA